MRIQQVLPIARLGERILSQSAAPVNKFASFLASHARSDK